MQGKSTFPVGLGCKKPTFLATSPKEVQGSQEVRKEENKQLMGCLHTKKITIISYAGIIPLS